MTLTFLDPPTHSKQLLPCVLRDATRGCFALPCTQSGHYETLQYCRHLIYLYGPGAVWTSACVSTSL